MIELKNHIIFDKIETWPIEVTDFIKKNEVLLREYYKIERSKPRSFNHHSAKWEYIKYSISTILNDYCIVGFHGTKLLDEEIDDVKKNGLRPLNVEFSNQRVEKLYKEGQISEQLRNLLINKEELYNDHRKGNVCVTHRLSSLRDQDGFNMLFGYWGGEALYLNLEEAKQLKEIGTSCIVFTSIKVHEFNAVHAEGMLANEMIEFYLNINSGDIDSFFKHELEVIGIVTRKDKCFNDLTGIDNWFKEY